MILIVPRIPAVITLSVGFLMVVILGVYAGELISRRYVGGAPCKEDLLMNDYGLLNCESIM